jgi:hypothetical protein
MLIALLGLLPATAASAATQGDLPSTAHAPSVGKMPVRVLSAEEIKDRGLSKYLRPAVKAGTASSGTCWSTAFRYGQFSAPELWGRTDVTLCSYGKILTYAASNCYGYSNFPTYNYLGCSNFPTFGAGFNIYRVKTQWTLCGLWVPIWGSCASTSYPWVEAQFMADGQYFEVGSGT